MAICSAENNQSLITDIPITIMRNQDALTKYGIDTSEPNQFDALASFTFNVGADALRRSTLRRKINRYEHEAVPAELMKWIYANARKVAGLTHRRRLEGDLYIS